MDSNKARKDEKWIEGKNVFRADTPEEIVKHIKNIHNSSKTKQDTP